MIEIPPDFPITKCPPGNAAGVDFRQCKPTGKSGAHIPNESKNDDELCRIAKAKIGMALLSIAKKSTSKNWVTERKMAEAWLMTREFEEWCDAAGLNPQYVRKRAAEIKDSGLTNYAKARTGSRYEERKRYREKMKGLNKS